MERVSMLSVDDDKENGAQVRRSTRCAVREGESDSGSPDARVSKDFAAGMTPARKKAQAAIRRMCEQKVCDGAK